MLTAKNSIISSVYLIAEALLKKSVGLVSTIILARYLMPEDFGIVAIATIVMGFLQVFASVGSEHYIIRSENITKNIIDSAFTLSFLLLATLALIMFVSSFYIASYYDDERIILLMQVYSLSLFISGLKNPYLSILRREQNVKSIVKVTFISKLISVALAVYIAISYQSYWALVVGTLSSIMLNVIGGYIIAPYKPRIDTSNIGEQWNFSKWLIPQALLGYFRTQFDTFYVSTSFGQTSLGAYNNMKYFAFIPSSDLVLPATSPLLAQLAPLRHIKDYFNTRYKVSTIITMFIALPIAVFLFHKAHNVVFVVLGSNWTEYSDLFAILSLLIPCYALYHNTNRLLLIYGKTRHSFYYEFIASASLISLLLSIKFVDVRELATAKVLLETVFTLIFFIVIAKSYTSLGVVFSSLISIMSIIVLCEGCVFICKMLVDLENPLINLFVSSGIFFALYTFALGSIIWVSRKRFDTSIYIWNIFKKKHT